jgi:hypothetical protein
MKKDKGRKCSLAHSSLNSPTIDSDLPVQISEVIPSMAIKRQSRG